MFHFHHSRIVAGLLLLSLITAGCGDDPEDSSRTSSRSRRAPRGGTVVMDTPLTTTSSSGGGTSQKSPKSAPKTQRSVEREVDLFEQNILRALARLRSRHRREQKLGLEMLAVLRQEDALGLEDFLVYIAKGYNEPLCPQALLAIGHLQLVDAYSTVEEAMAAQEPAIRKNAAIAMGLLGEKKAIYPLLERLDDTDAEVRAHVVEALGNLEAVEAFAQLVPLLDIDENPVAAMVVKTLGKLAARRVQRHEKSLQLLYPYLDIRRPNTVARTLKVIGLAGDDNAIAKIVPLMKSDHWLIRKAAVETLTVFDAEKVTSMLVEMAKKPLTPRNERIIAIDALAGNGRKKDIPVLFSSLQQERDAVMRFHLADTLIALGDFRAIPHFISLLEETDWDEVDLEKEDYLFEIERKLERISERDYGREARMWQLWWKRKKKHFLKNGGN